MHPAALAALTGAGLMAGCALVFSAMYLADMHRQERAFRQSAYASRSHYSAAGAPRVAQDSEEDALLESIYDEVRQELRDVRRLPAGEERRRRVRQLKRTYHPDKFPASLRGIMTQVSAFINLQTQHLC